MYSKVAAISILVSLLCDAQGFSTLPSTGLRTSTSTLHYNAGAATFPLQDPINPSGVNIPLPGQPRKVEPRNTGPQAQKVLSMEEFKAVVTDETEKIVVCKFYAPWCRACKSIAPSYSRIVKQFGDANIKFVDVPIDAVNNEVHRELGIKTYPLAQIYHPQAGLLEQRKIGRIHLPEFHQILRSYAEGFC